MNEMKMKELGAIRLGDKAIDPYESLRIIEIEIGFVLPEDLCGLLKKYEGAIFFDEGAKFRPLEPSPITSKSGYQSLETLYGLGSGKHSIIKKVSVYCYEQIPQGFLPIGAAPGGNQICLAKDQSVHFWNHESEEDGLFLIASSFSDFIDLLETDNEEVNLDGVIIESESWMDF